jgi:hypothetical protein
VFQAGHLDRRCSISIGNLDNLGRPMDYDPGIQLNNDRRNIDERSVNVHFSNGVFLVLERFSSKY